MWPVLLLIILALLGVLSIARRSSIWTVFRKDDIQRFGSVVGMFRNSDRLFRISYGPVKLLGTCHPDVIQQILTNPGCVERPFFYRFTGLEQGLLSARHQQWKIQRRALNPTFNLKILNSFIPIFETCSRKMVEELKGLESGSTVNILHHVSKCTLEMVFGTTIGMDVLQRDDTDEVLGYIERLFNLVSRRMLSAHLYFDWIYRFTKDYREDQRLRKICMEKANEIINQQKKNIMDQLDINGNLETNSEDHYNKPEIFIVKLLSETFDGKTFSDEEIFHNAYTIIVAGNDTSALTVASCCLFLAMYPTIQDKVHSEIVQIFPSKHSPINADDLKQLVYLEMVIKETLRLCPVAPNIAREALQDVLVDGTVVPKGTILLMSFYALHRRNDIWGDASEEFNPENFDPDRSKSRHPFGYLPFSGGSRNCIGWRYAMMSVKIMLVHLVREFKLSTKLTRQDLRYRFDMTLKLAIEHLIINERRQLLLEDDYNSKDDSDSEDTCERLPTIINQLLRGSVDGKPFTNAEIADNAYTIILGGNEPSALSVANTCLFLALYPRVQQQLYTEILQIIPDKSCAITHQTLQDLPYLDMVLQETLRLCPAIPNIARETIRTVSIDGRRIPAGTMFLISFYALHRRGDFWGDTVTEFDPERFHPDCGGYQRHPFGYLPFSGGARNCIGWQYAQSSMKIALIRLVREFKLSTRLKRRDLRFKFDLTLKLAFEHLIQLDRRD
ncbi:hypothetical protein pipiens_008518 [Culex pipiens pipiens]|uniref:Cytochrome P450 n=1 Tax=Culex pipiens pipiens TaxID=38569 RepID=A0ABD1DHG7_CULPP